MRKLVKKLALVLALVLALGCIAPASAQAAEVRRSWNFAPDAYKPTYSMTVGDDYSFELYDQGDAIDPSIYDVAYYSKSDALAMSKSTGYAVAVAAAEGVKICAVVTNKVTGNTAKVWGLVDIAAKVVETTPEATPTVETTPEATPTEAPFALVAAEQYSKNQMLLTFNGDAADVKKTDVTIKYSLAAGSNAKYNCYVKGNLEAGDADNTLIATFYQNFKDDSFAYVSYGEATFEVPISVGRVSAISIVTSEVEAKQDEEANIEIRLLDENGMTLEITTLDKLPEGDYCDLIVTGGEDEDGNLIAYSTGNGVYIDEIGHEVLVEIEYTTMDKEGNEVPLYDGRQIVCADLSPIVAESTFVVTGESNKNNFHKSDKVDYSKNVRICIGDTKYIAGKLKVYVPELGKDLSEIDPEYMYTRKSDDFADGKIVYESSDNTVVLVDNYGKLVPVSTGAADIIVSYAPTYDDENNEIPGDIIGVASLVVEAKRELSELRVDSTTTQTLSTLPDAYDSVKFNITGYDQYKEKIAINKDQVKLVQVTEPNATTISNVAGNSNLAKVTNGSSNTVDVTLFGNDGTPVKKNTYTFEVQKKDNEKIKTKTFKVTFATATTAANKYKLEVAPPDKSEVKVQAEADLLSKAKQYTLTAWGYAGSVKLDDVKIVGLYDKTAKGVTIGSIFYDVTVPGGEDKDAFVSAVTVSGTSLSFDALKNRASSAGEGEWAPEAWKAGTYTFTLYKYNTANKAQAVATAQVKIENGQENITASVENIKASEAWTYDMVVTGAGVSSYSYAGKITATKVSAGDLFSALFKDSADDTDFCIELNDGNTKIDFENANYVVTGLTAYVNGKDTIVVTEVTLTKKYTGGTTVVRKATVSGGTITFAE